jgi:predicted aconitase with swiveling domain
MPELFNMIAGSETGAILASTLSLSTLGHIDNITAM